MAEDGMGPIRYAVIDAFTDEPFRGNPAAVCLLEEIKDTEWMQKVANEFNLSETAFLRRRSASSASHNGDDGYALDDAKEFDLRWFTPLVEVELASGELVEKLQPEFDEIKRCSGTGIIVTGLAPEQSGFDFFSRAFWPKLGINEDPVSGSAHCALAPYWAKKLGKTELVAHQASKRGGKLVLQVVEDPKSVALQGEAVTIMLGVLKTD